MSLSNKRLVYKGGNIEACHLSYFYACPVSHGQWQNGNVNLQRETLLLRSNHGRRFPLRGRGHCQSWLCYVYIAGKEMGITDFVNSKACGKPVHEVIRELTDGGVDYSFECSGNVDVLREAFVSTHDVRKFPLPSQSTFLKSNCQKEAFLKSNFILFIFF